jgi:F-type H+-transporting ATPase subunit delta
MAAATVAAVYAQALLEVADDRGNRAAVVRDCRELPDVLTPDLVAKLDDPRLGKRQAKELLGATLGRSVETDVLNLLNLLVDRNRLADAVAIAREAVRQAEAAVGLLRVDVATAVPLDDAAVRKLAENLGRALGGTAQVSRVVDPDLIGGLTLRVGDNFIDGSVKRHLIEMRRRMLDAPVSARQLWA